MGEESFSKADRDAYMHESLTGEVDRLQSGSLSIRIMAAKAGNICIRVVGGSPPVYSWRSEENGGSGVEEE
jgi:hypothetical protein